MAGTRQPTFDPGDELLLRYLEGQRTVLGAFPVRVVEDTGPWLVVWLAAGTRVRYWSTLEGTDPRTVPLDARYRSAHGSLERRWHGGGVLRVIPVDRLYQVVHFWHPSGSFAGWYVNFESPKRIDRAKVDTVDWQLDLWIDADGRPSWKDEDEAAAAVAAGYLDPADLARARAAGDGIIAGFDDWLAEVGDWRGWRPPASWTVPGLPDDWAA
ncbi:MAG TPA: DUF402 domain-containing protein [Acidimicrobiales bacterium]|nr:DUF402 domain-containing protein [Acidimicrobiales bacterium]